MLQIQVGPMLFQLLHYWNQSKDPVKENNYIYTKDFMLKYYLRLGVLDPVFGCRVIPDTPENFFKGYCDSKNVIIVEYLFIFKISRHHYGIYNSGSFNLRNFQGCF